MRFRRNSSVRSLPASLGPRPGARPPSWWHQPHDVANSFSPSMALAWVSPAGGAGRSWAAVLAAAPTTIRKAGIRWRGVISTPAYIPPSGAERECSTPPARRLIDGEYDERADVLRHVLERAAEERGVLVADQRAPSGRHRDILLALGGIADDPADVADAVVVRPELTPTVGVVGAQPAAGVGDEHEVAARRQETRQRRLREHDLPLLLAGHGIAARQVPVGLAALRIAQLEVRADVELRLRLEDGRRLHDLEVHAPLLADLVVQAGLRAVRARVPADAARDRGAEIRVLAQLQVAPPDEGARLGIDALDEVDVLHQRPHVHDGGVLAVVHEDEAALVGVDDQLLAVPVQHQELTHRAVEVPGVVGQLLVVEL